MKRLHRIIGLLTFSLVLSACSEEFIPSRELYDYIPQNASVIFKSNDLEILRKDLQQNEALSGIKATDLYKLISGKHDIMRHLKPKGTSLISINRRSDSLFDYTFVSKKDSALFVIDSLKNKSSETLKYNGFTIDRVELGNETVYTTLIDSIFIASSSQQLLQDIVSGKHLREADTRKALELSKGNELMVLSRSPFISIQDSVIPNFTSHLAMDITIAANGISGAGVAMARDSAAQLINVFKGQKPQKSNLISVLPTDANSVVMFTFNSALDLINNLKVFRSDTLSTPSSAIFETITEVGDFYFSEGHAIVLNSIDGGAAREALDPLLSENSTFRDVDIYTFSQPEIFVNSFGPLIHQARPSLAFRLDDYFIFSESLQIAEKIITAYKSNNVLANTDYFKTASQQLGNSYTLNIIHFNSRVGTGLSNVFLSESPNRKSHSTSKKYPFSVLQFSYDRDFAHANFVCLEAGERKQISGRLTQLMSRKLNDNILGTPALFSNHRTGGQDIVVQDFKNKLHLLASNGKTLWSKSLDGPVIGEVHEVDLLRNGKKQLAFVTKNKFHIIDRNGKPVAPFPINFKDAITQPLSVFDYDSNRKYRFAVVQGREIFLYDNKGKVVNGFKFKKTASDIAQEARHFRIGSKDYIVIPEKNGNLNILSRVGSPRVSVSKKFNFSQIPITIEGSNFVVITSENAKESISTNGKVSSRSLEVSGRYWFTTEAKTKVTLDDNLLRIDGNLVELPFGVYTIPKIHRVNRKTYVSITETQEKKVYVYDASGILIAGFPVYGSSIAELGDVNKNGKLNILVKGSDNEIILYQLE